MLKYGLKPFCAHGKDKFGVVGKDGGLNADGVCGAVVILNKQSRAVLKSVKKNNQIKSSKIY